MRPTWIDPVESFEKAVHDAVDRAYDDPSVHDPLAAFVERITPYGWTNSLAQKLVQLTMPGVPDVYQGTELWEDSLVDPDNRRPVDTELRRTHARRARRAVRPAGDRRRRRGEALGGVARAAVAARLPGRVRVVHAAAGARGRQPSTRSRSTAAARSRWRPGCRSGWSAPAVGATPTLDVGGPVSDLISGRRWSGELRLAELLADYPVALLVR